MSILIKGMEMPTACSKCDCGNRDYGFCQITRDSWWHIDPSTERIENCPLVPIPDHGDLIDRDAVERLAVEIWMRNSNGDDAMQELIHKLREGFPAVIPAEMSEASLCICDSCDQRNDKGCSVCKYINERSEE